MRKFLMVVLCLWWSVGLSKECPAQQGATPLRGETVKQNSGGEPLDTVEIGAAFCANPTYSDSFGLFQLDIQGKKPGDKIQLKVKKEGFEVVNQSELTVYLRSDPDDLVKIVLCPMGERDRNALRYYGIVEENVLAKDARKDETEAVLAFAKEFTKTLAEKNLDDMSDLYKQAFQAFQKGDLKQAQKILDAAKLEDELRQAKEELRKAEERLRQLEGAQQKSEDLLNAPTFPQYAYLTVAQDMIFFDESPLIVQTQSDPDLQQALKAKHKAEDAVRKSIENYMLKARFCVANLQFVDAEANYQIAIDANPKNFENLFEFALYLQKQNQFLKALPLYKKALFLAKTDNDVARILNNLGVLNLNLNQYPAALHDLQRALKIKEKLAATDPTAYLPGIAMTLNNLGALSWKLNQHTKAMDAYQRALKMYEELATTNPQTYLPEVAGTLNNLGILNWELNQYSKAIDAYQRALKIREEFAQTNPQAYLPEVAETLNNLGNSYLSMKQYEAATDAYQRALKIYEELAATNPQSYLPNVAMSLNNLGNSYQITKQYEAATDIYQRALKIYEELAASNPQTYLSYVAITSNNLAILYQQKSDYMAALPLYKRALEIREQLAQDGSGCYDFDICETFLGLSMLYKRLSTQAPQPEYKPEALGYLNRAITLMQKYPEVPRAQLFLKDAQKLKTYFEGLPDPLR